MGMVTAPATVVDRLKNAQYAMTLEEIGEQIGVTRERVRQIEKQALEKLRRCCMPQLVEMRAMALEMRKRGGAECHGVIR